jgi:biofilm PGA synthesis N-glycosyltransferase PgaC
MTAHPTQILNRVVVFYPLFLSLLRCGLALAWSWRWEGSDHWRRVPPGEENGLPVSLLIPCFNEGPHLADTLRAASQLRWPEWEVIAISDGSTDDTARQLEAWAATEPRLRVVHLASNQGKALAMRTGALLARHEVLLCIDADALLDPHAVGWMVRHFSTDSRLGAVTGNPRIRNRSTLL